MLVLEGATPGRLLFVGVGEHGRHRFRCNQNGGRVLALVSVVFAAAAIQDSGRKLAADRAARAVAM